MLGQQYDTAMLSAARAAYIASDKKTHLANGVWMIDKAGKVDAPPAVRNAKASTWSVVHMAGNTEQQPPSIDAITVEKPLDFIPPELRTEQSGACCLGCGCLLIFATPQRHQLRPMAA
jgi:hypothetical protein